jgi:hypothetical protein
VLEALLLKRCGTTAAVARAWVGFVVNAPNGVAGDRALYFASLGAPLFLIMALTTALSCCVVCAVNGCMTDRSVPQTLLVGMMKGGVPLNLASARRIRSTVAVANSFIPSSARSPNVGPRLDQLIAV